MSKPVDLHSATGVIVSVPGIGIMQWYGSDTPTNSQAGYAPSCTYHCTSNGKLYSNTGTVLSSTWGVTGSQS